MIRSLSFLFVNVVLVFVIAACGAALNDPPRGETLAPTRAITATTAPAQETLVSTATRVPPTATRVPATATRVPPSATSAPTRVPPTQTAAPTETRAASNNNPFGLDLEPLATDFKRPIFVTQPNDGTNRLFIVEQQGRIYFLNPDSDRKHLFLDLRELVNDTANEQGLLGLAFHPDYKNNGLFFVNYSNADGDNVVARYHVSDDPNKADPDSAKIILTLEGLEPNHNGGMLAFRGDGYLYIGTGDGGGGGDPHGTNGNGQNLDTLLGKILRVDVNANTYRVPDDNPFVRNSNARPEIWVYGLRNPWRFSFDRATGDLYIADVGQALYEEIDFQPASSGGGENFGWRIMEGAHCFNPSTNCSASGLVNPIFEYTHDFGCAVTGGYVYRGKQFPWLVGKYIFADYCTGVVWVTERDASGKWNARQVTTFDDTISSFGEDQQGELYVMGHGSGTIYKLTSSQ